MIFEIKGRIKDETDTLIIIDDIAFFGGTMFTDFTLYNNPVMHIIDAMMGINDFRCIEIDNRIWSTNDHINYFYVFKQKLSDFLNEVKNEKKIVNNKFNFIKFNICSRR